MLTSKTRSGLTIVSTTYARSRFEEPCSPVSSTNSFISNTSWIAEKSATELGSLLRDAYHSLRKKEKDLELVAEIGQSLLEYNQSLKEDYNNLLKNASTLAEQEDMRLISNKRAYEKIIKTLEHKNEEIQHMLEHTKHQSRLSAQNHEKSQRKLETEIEILQSSLEIAAQKVQELEERRLLCQERANRQYELKLEQQRKEDLALLEELSTKMEQVHKENRQLQKTKQQIEIKLMMALEELEKLRKEFEQFEVTQQGYVVLQEAFQKQTDHVRELNHHLEEHRVGLSSLGDAMAMSNTSTCNLMHELDSAVCLAKGDMTYPSKRDTYSTERHLASYSPADYALDTIVSSLSTSLNEAEICKDFIGGIHYTEFNLYPPLKTFRCSPKELKPNGWFGRLFSFTRNLFHSFFRWCRFTLILAAAVLMNLWKGPDLLSEK